MATEPENLIIGKADLWDSGEQATGKPHTGALFIHCFFLLFQPIASKNGPIDAGVVGTKVILNVLMDFRQQRYCLKRPIKGHFQAGVTG